MNFGIIADGNRRWARREGIQSKKGHEKGFLAIKNEILPILYENKEINAMTVYAFSTENWKRSVLEVKYLMELCNKMLEIWLPELLEKEIKIIHCGRKDRIPGFLKNKINEAEEKSKDNTKFTIYLCLDYGGRDEILRAAEKEGSLENNLEVADLDIILRTGGDHRLSNFCIWQAAYAEFFFLDKFLPEIKKNDIEELLEDFKNRDRRKGK